MRPELNGLEKGFLDGFRLDGRGRLWLPEASQTPPGAASSAPPNFSFKTKASVQRLPKRPKPVRTNPDWHDVSPTPRGICHGATNQSASGSHSLERLVTPTARPSSLNAVGNQPVHTDAGPQNHRIPCTPRSRRSFRKAIRPFSAAVFLPSQPQ